MFKALFLATLLITLVVNIIFLLATKDKPPDAAAAAGQQPTPQVAQQQPKRLFLRSNDLYDYTVEPNSASLVTTVRTSQPSALLNGSNTENNKLKIRVKSSRRHVQVSADDIVIYESKSSQSDADDDDDDIAQTRGIHVLVLNQFNGQLMAARVFDTYSPGQDLELCHFLGQLQEGRLLVLAVRDEASFKMAANSPARLLLQKLGSRHIMRLRWRDMWAFVGWKRTRLETERRLGESFGPSEAPANLAEGLTRSTRFSDWAPPVVLETLVALRPAADLQLARCNWSNETADELARRSEFCSAVEGYGRVCDCHSPCPISFAPNQGDEPLPHWQLDEVPVLVMASNRPYYLYRMLRSLLQVRGLRPSQVIVSIDGFYQEPRQVSQLFGLQFVQQRPRGRRSARISHHYKWSLGATFRRLFPRAQFAIVLEEDLDVARDALIYFNQTLAVLREDPSLYCVSAWNDQGYEHSARDPNLLYRVETMPGLGWMLSRRLYLDELEPRWPPANEPHDWDMWIRTDQIRRGRECIIPDVSRTYHFGATGTNINSYFQRQYFSKHAFSSANFEPKQFPHFPELQLMFASRYERHLADLIRSARVLRPGAQNNQTELLCSLADADADPNTVAPAQSTHTVIFIQMIDERDFRNWLRLAKCWRIWDLDARGQHQSVWRLYLGGVHTLVVGVPASPHAHLKPPDLAPFSLLPAS